jgi:hypothetical protein
MKNNVANLFKKTILVALVAALAVAALPLTNVFAAPAQDPATPPAPGGRITERLERLWQRTLKGLDRANGIDDRSSKVIEKTQAFIDKAKANGKDVTAVQAALDAYKQATTAALPMVAQAQEIANSHNGFDSAGKVTDVKQAAATLKELATQLKAIRSEVLPSAKALHEAIKNFREANPPANATSTPKVN